MGSMDTLVGYQNDGGHVTKNKPHLDITLWLKTLQLHEQYGGLFEKFSGVEEIIHYGGRELLDLGVKNAAHRATLQSGLAVLREKYKSAVMRKNSSTVTTTLAGGHTIARAANTVDGNMNRIENASSSSPNMVVSSDEENYINHRLQYSTTSISARKLSNIVNNNESPHTDPDDIRGHLWYHGSIGRSQAEALVESGHPDECSGQFLVRDCISRAGNYVLTCKWNGSILHFMINRTVQNSTPNSLYERVMYHFEDEHYQSVPDLIRAYVGQKKPVTDESQCIISKPVNRPLHASTLRHTVSEKSCLRIVDDDREQGNYVRMRPQQPTTTPTPGTVSNRGSISANGIANLKIPQVPESIRNRPLPPVPHSSSPLTSKGGAGSTLRNRVMLKEARRHQLNKWRSESALEDPAHDSGGQAKKTQPISDGTPESGGLHASTSLQALNNAKSNNGLESIQQQQASTSESEPETTSAPAKPRRAPSLKNREKPMLVIRDSKTGQFREISEIELEHDEEDEEEEGDYHEYCDIDYDQLPDPQPRPKMVIQSKKGDSKMDTTPPALPPRPKTGAVPFLGQDRDSACVPDMVLYDRPSSMCKPYSPRTAPQKTPTTDHYDVIVRKDTSIVPGTVSRVKTNFFKSTLLPLDVKPLDGRVWAKIKNILLTQEAQTLALAATKADSTFLNLVDDERLLEFVPNHALSSLILLPKGDHLRKDIVERATCWKFFVTSTLLQDEPEETRVKILAKWIEMAKVVKEKLGNQFAFSNVMAALTSPQVCSLSSLWRRLSMDFPRQADLFNKTLRPSFLTMQRCTAVDAQFYSDLCIPDLEPVARVYGAASINDVRLFDWEDEESTGEDVYGLDSFWHRLQQARQWPLKIHQWRLNYFSLIHSMTDDNECTAAEAMFQTEFHMRFLFGAKGCTVPARERYTTFQRILAAMALNVGE